MGFHRTPTMALLSSSVFPHSLMLPSYSSTSSSSSISKLFFPLARFSKNPETFISSVSSLQTRGPSLSRLQPIRSSTCSDPSSSSAHERQGEGDSSRSSSRIFIKGTFFSFNVRTFYRGMLSNTLCNYLFSLYVVLLVKLHYFYVGFFISCNLIWQLIITCSLFVEN